MSDLELSLPIRFDFIDEDAITEGAHFRREFALVYDDGDLWNTAGYDAFMRIRKSIDGPTVLDLHGYQGRIEVGIHGLPGFQYNLAVELPGTVTNGLAPWGRGVYDLLLRDNSNRWMRVLEGLCALSPTVTPPY